ncbi:MAG: hypothetical protein KKF30_10675 [Proteobacteria bacterium]|nr:hypothetical protein [Pseudomonadota bacterium]MBU4470357.1 hypothetical protein [Pseudomonadota bacterium]MCG2752768.1 hypothetical protein [Desulfobacteraceae bacterium]
MGTNIMKKVAVMVAKVFPFMLPFTVLGQDIQLDRYRQGYGALGQGPDEIMGYGQAMMRYGFHEMGKLGKFGKYPAYKRHLNPETLKKLHAEQEAFIKGSEDLRYTLYEKELCLKTELAKKEPDDALAMAFQNELSENRKELERKMTEHLLRMKKISLGDHQNKEFLSKGKSYVVENRVQKIF